MENENQEFKRSKKAESKLKIVSIIITVYNRNNCIFCFIE